MKPLLLLVLCAAQADRAEGLFQKVKFEAAELPGEGERRALAIVGDKVHWIGAFRSLEERIGPWPDDLTVDVAFDLTGEDPSRADYRDHQGFIQFNLGRLAQYQKKIDDLELQKKALAKEGKRVVFRVTPLRIERLVYHELTIVLERDLEAPFWFRVGMAAWIGEDTNYLTGLANSGKKIQAVDAPVQEPSDAFGRGHSFWKWLEMKGMAKAVARAVLFEKVPWKKALEERTGLGWDKLAEAERDWSERLFEKLRGGAR